jgi:hypothetical protein
MSKPWKARARDSMQRTMGSRRMLVDCEVRVRRRPCSPDSSATTDLVKVPFLEGD